MNAIELRGISFGYRGGPPILRDVSFSVAVGECAGLIGPNGAGKSTLILLMNGLLRGQGEVLALGQSVLGVAPRDLRKRVGVVFQDPDDQLFMPNVLEDVALGPLNLGSSPAEADHLARTALESAGILYAADRAPHRLSLGERKRVALAAILAMKPEVLVLDEPTAGLDPRGRHEFMELLQSFPATKIIASHDLDLVARVCGRVLVLDGGRLVAAGPVATILSDQPLLAAHGLAPPLSALPAAPAV